MAEQGGSDFPLSRQSIEPAGLTTTISRRNVSRIRLNHLPAGFNVLRFFLVAAIVWIVSTCSIMPCADSAAAAEPGWSSVVIPTGEYREQIKSLPIEQRPYRPLHFYGNTIRRSHYRGNPIAMPRDIRSTTGELIRRR